MTLAHYALAVFHEHATIHEKLDRVHTAYREILLQLESKEIKSFKNDARYAKLEDLKRELLEIRFL